MVQQARLKNTMIGILTGTTASGKTALALDLASKYGLEIINADSMLVYRSMDIGTAKPSREELARVPHHLIDIRDPDQPYTAADFARDAATAITGCEARGKRALIVGGTGFYLKALLHGVWNAPPTNAEVRARLETLASPELWTKLLKRDPKSAERIGAADRYRLIRALEIIELSGKSPSELETEQSPEPDARFKLWVIDRAQVELDARIAARTRAMLDAGLIDEVKVLLERYPTARALSAVGYAETVAYLEGRAPEGRKPAPGLAGLRSEIDLATRQLVKRQRTWFKGQHPYAQVFELERDARALEDAFHEVYS